jgi:hypothetical protein
VPPLRLQLAAKANRLGHIHKVERDATFLSTLFLPGLRGRCGYRGVVAAVVEPSLCGVGNNAEEAGGTSWCSPARWAFLLYDDRVRSRIFEWCAFGAPTSPLRRVADLQHPAKKSERRFFNLRSTGLRWIT